MNAPHPSNPYLWQSKIRLNAPDADAYDDIGDPWWYCETHDEWWSGYCSGCNPVMDRFVKIGATVAAIAIAGVYFGAISWAIFAAMT